MSTVVVTGAGRGVGYFTAEKLAARGHRVVLTTRDGQQAEVAMASIRERVPGASLQHVALDLASLASIRRAADELEALGPIDVLVNNAGRTNGTGRRETTEDGLEVLVGTNAFGPFALTSLLMPSITGRVVSLGSLSTRLATADLADLQLERHRYGFGRAYAYSKHGVHAFAFELDRRLRAAGDPRRSLLAHPGWAHDGVAPARPGITDRGSRAQRAAEQLMRPFAHGKDRGADAVVLAATDPDAEGGTFYGPSRQTTGRPAPARPVAQSASPEFGAAFWRLAEEATGVRFAV